MPDQANSKLGVDDLVKAGMTADGSLPLRPYKFVVQAVVQQLGPDGTVIGEATTEPAVIFGCDKLAQYAHDFLENLKTARVQEPQQGG